MWSFPPWGPCSHLGPHTVISASLQPRQIFAHSSAFRVAWLRVPEAGGLRSGQLFLGWGGAVGRKPTYSLLTLTPSPHTGCAHLTWSPRPPVVIPKLASISASHLLIPISLPCFTLLYGIYWQVACSQYWFVIFPTRLSTLWDQGFLFIFFIIISPPPFTV